MLQVKSAFGVGHRKTQLYQRHCAKLNMRTEFCFVHCIEKNDVPIHFSEQKLFFIRYLWIFANRFVKEFEGCLTIYFSACDSKVRMAFVNWQQWKGRFIPAFCESLVAKKKKKDLGDFWQTLCYVIFFFRSAILVVLFPWKLPPVLRYFPISKPRNFHSFLIGQISFVLIFA